MKNCDIKEYGAIGDGKTLNTEAIQKAIDCVSEHGGGTVYVSNGHFVTGTLFFRENIILRIEAGASILGSLNYNDYSTDVHYNRCKNETHMDRCLFYGENVSTIGIEGHGEIDGRGHKKNFPKQRPMMFRFKDCRNIRIRDITFRNPAAWTFAVLFCTDIAVDGITIKSRANQNGDGLDFDACQDVRVSNSSFDTSDDSIVLHNSDPQRVCKNFTVTNCNFSSKWAGMRIGLLSMGDFENVTVNNCNFNNIDDSGLKIQMNEGGVMKNMVFSNLVMKNVPRPVFMTLCSVKACRDNPEEHPPAGEIRNMIFSNIVADASKCSKDSGFFFSGLPGKYIKDIILDNIIFISPGGGTAEDAVTEGVAEFDGKTLDGWWPEYRLLKRTIPSRGLYARHVKGLEVRNFKVISLNPDERKDIVLEDVEIQDQKEHLINVN